MLFRGCIQAQPAPAHATALPAPVLLASLAQAAAFAASGPAPALGPAPDGPGPDEPDEPEPGPGSAAEPANKRRRGQPLTAPAPGAEPMPALKPPQHKSRSGRKGSEDGTGSTHAITKQQVWERQRSILRQLALIPPSGSPFESPGMLG